MHSNHNCFQIILNNRYLKILRTTGVGISGGYWVIGELLLQLLLVLLQVLLSYGGEVLDGSHASARVGVTQPAGHGMALVGYQIAGYELAVYGLSSLQFVCLSTSAWLVYYQCLICVCQFVD